MSMAVNFVGGIPFQLLYDVVKLGIRKNKKFRNMLLNIQITLDGLQPHIMEGIQQNTRRLQYSTETIQQLQRTVEDGNILVNGLVNLSMCNILLGYCGYGCQGSHWEDQLTELDRNLRVLTSRLQMETVNILYEVIAHLAPPRRDISDGLDRLERNVHQILEMMHRGAGRSGASSSGGEGGSISTGAGGAGEGSPPASVLGLEFQQLYDISMQANVKHVMYKRLTERLKSTLQLVKPVIEEITKHNKILHLPMEQVTDLIFQLKNGAEIVNGFSKIRRRAKYKENEDTIRFVNLNTFLQRLIIRLIVQVEIYVNTTNSDSAEKIDAGIDNIETGNVAQVDDLGAAKGDSASPATASSIVELRLDPISNTQVFGRLEQSDEEEKHSEETEKIAQPAFPEECIGNIIALTTPADVCRLSLVSKRFKSAADSDQVWEKFFPSPHHILLIESRSASSSTIEPAAKSKKEAYLALCDKQVLVDDGKMSFWLDKWSGKTCYMVCAKELRIAWADGKSGNWSWISIAESRFELVALLDYVFWLEIRGKIDLSVLSPRTCYKAYLVYKFTEKYRGLNVPVEVAVAKRDYGFEYEPLDAALAEGKVDQTVYLEPSTESEDEVRRPKKREDGWFELEVGEFRCQGEEDGELEMICGEIKDLGWKSGLIVEGFEVRPERKEYSWLKPS